MSLSSLALAGSSICDIHEAHFVKLVQRVVKLSMYPRGMNSTLYKATAASRDVYAVLREPRHVLSGNKNSNAIEQVVFQ